MPEAQSEAQPEATLETSSKATHQPTNGATPKATLKATDRAVLKFSSEDCGICHKMAFYDEKVAKELNLTFVDIKMQDTETYRKYRQVLLSQYPDKSDMGWPTYIVCDDPDGAFSVVGEVKGGHPKGEFRKRLQDVIEAS